MTHNFNELDVIRNFKLGDEVAFQQLYRLYSKQIFGYLCKIIGNREEAEDCLQIVFMKLIDNRKKIREDLSLKFWLYKVAGNLAKTKYRYIKLNQKLLNEFKENQNPDQQTENNFAIDNLIKKLPHKKREILELRYYGKLSLKEISKTLKLSEGTVKSRIFYSLDFLREKMRRNYEK